MENISKRKIIEVLIRLTLLACFFALTALKVNDLLLEETGISLQTKKRDVEIPTISICFSSDAFESDKMEEISPSQFIGSTEMSINSVRNGIRTIIIQPEDWNQFYFSTYIAPHYLFPCFYLDSPISTIHHPDYVKVVAKYFFFYEGCLIQRYFL